MHHSVQVTKPSRACLNPNPTQGPIQTRSRPNFGPVEIQTKSDSNLFQIQLRPNLTPSQTQLETQSKYTHIHRRANTTGYRGTTC